MPNIALIPNSAPEIPPLTAVVDGFPSETHRIRAVTGGEPVENGVTATDHAVYLSEEVEFTGWVSGWAGGKNPAAAWTAVRTLAKTLEPVRVVTEWGTYPEMLVIEAEAPKRDRGMRFKMIMRWINRVGIVDSALPAGNVSGPATGRSGEQAQGRRVLGPSTPF